MTDPTLAAVEAVAAPLLQDAEKALAPEARKVLTDLHQFVSDEADKLRQELPSLVEAGVQHLHALGASILGRYQAVMEHIDAHLTGTVTPAAPSTPTLPADGSGAVTPSTSSATPAASSDPTVAAPAPQTTDTTTSATPSEPSSTDSASATAPAETPEA
jgi:ElaB/YqjD/DUF883 family membrane-anchored ribosome-binding protein